MILKITKLKLTQWVIIGVSFDTVSFDGNGIDAVSRSQIKLTAFGLILSAGDGNDATANDLFIIIIIILFVYFVLCYCFVIFVFVSLFCFMNSIIKKLNDKNK